MMKSFAVLLCSFLLLFPVHADFGRPLRQVEPEIEVAKLLPAARSWDAWYFAHDLLQNEVQALIRQHENPVWKDWLDLICSREKIYRSIYGSRIVDAGQPSLVSTLPIVESSLFWNAVSRSGAVGLWQFMPVTAAAYTLRMDTWLDERRDPLKAADAAIRLLDEQLAYLHSWPLSFAAYNSGFTRLLNTQRQGFVDYWTLIRSKQLPEETRRFVPKLLAYYWIFNQKRYYQLPVHWEYPQYAEIVLEQAVNIELLASALELDYSLLRRLNGALNYPVTPPQNYRYTLKIPIEHADNVERVLSEGSVFVDFYVYTIRSGDTLYALSRHFDLPLDVLMAHNSHLVPESLRIGSRLLVPRIDDRVYAIDETEDQRAYTRPYVVQAGDTLWNIASLAGTAPELLAQRNNIRLDSIIRVGQVLLLPELE